MIIEINEWDDPQKMDYEELAKTVSGGIVKVQKGLEWEDHAFLKHGGNLKKAGVPVAVYAVVRGRSAFEMAKEAEAFWYRGRELQPAFWWLMVEEETMTSMRDGLEIYRFFLNQLGAKKIGVCTTSELYPQLGVNRRKFDGLWLKDPTESQGKANKYRCDLKQEAVKRLTGYEGRLRLNRMVDMSRFGYFFGEDFAKQAYEKEVGQLFFEESKEGVKKNDH